MVSAALNVVGTEIGDAHEATRVDNGFAAGRGIGSVRLRHLEEHAAERVVDLLAPAPAKTSTSKQAAKRAKVQDAVKPTAARKKKSKRVPTRSPKRSAPPASASKQAANPKARAAVKVKRVFSWRVYRGALYYQVHLQRGVKTIYQVRTLKRTASIHLKLRPGRYHAVVRPAIPSDVGIILGPAIMDKIVRV